MAPWPCDQWPTVEAEQEREWENTVEATAEQGLYLGELGDSSHRCQFVQLILLTSSISQMENLSEGEGQSGIHSDFYILLSTIMAHQGYS